MSPEPDREGNCTYCGAAWDERHEKYGCPEEAEARLEEAGDSDG